VLAVFLIAGSLGLSNFVASIAIGLSGIDHRLRIRIALIFGLFEAAMPLIGLLAGRSLAHTLGSSAHIIGGILLIATGAHATYAALRANENEAAASFSDASQSRLVLLGAALSIDNLIVGFALGADHSPLILSIVTITAVSVGLSLIGLEVGARLGTHVERHGELIGGIVLSCVGVARCSVGELADAVEMEPSAVSHQLRTHRQLGLVVGQRTGRQVIYALHDDHVAALLNEAVFQTEHLRLAASRPLTAAPAS
jgi:putative Mn2+ efflux pump MntP